MQISILWMSDGMGGNATDFDQRLISLPAPVLAVVMFWSTWLNPLGAEGEAHVGEFVDLAQKSDFVAGM